MLGGELYRRFTEMTQEEKNYAIGWFFAQVSMDFDGFSDSDARPAFIPAKYTLIQMGEAMLMAERQCDPLRRQANFPARSNPLMEELQ